jgi:hypothetical protein
MQNKLKKLIGQQVDVSVMSDGFEANVFDKLVFWEKLNLFVVGGYDKRISFTSEKVKRIVRLDDETTMAIMLKL